MKLLYAVLLGFGCAIGASASTDIAAIVGMSASVLKIEVQRVQGGYAMGSGVVVQPGQIVTNCHVTRDAARIHVLRGGVRWRVELQSADIEHDLCLLHVPQMQAHAVQLGSATELRPGQSLLALGYTGGQGMQSSRGDVVALHRHDDSHVIQSSNWFNSGASGGGLFDRDMKLVGVLTYRLRGGEAHYFAAPVDWVRTLLEDASRWQAVGPLPAGRLSYWQRGVAEQPRFLQAALLERRGDWAGLAQLAAVWAQAEAGVAEPWVLRGIALAHLNRERDALDALERAVSLEPAATEAWFWLGLLHLQGGRLADAHRARASLAPLHVERAKQLAQVMDHL